MNLIKIFIFVLLSLYSSVKSQIIFNRNKLKEWIPSFSNLAEINLVNKSIIYIDSAAFDGLENLEKLSLQYNYQNQNLTDFDVFLY